MQLDIVLKDEKYRPCYANETDACLDLKACIPISNPLPSNVRLSHDSLSIIIDPGTTVKVGTGVKVSIPNGYVMLMYPRSSTGIKKNLVLANSVGIIDSGYRDEIIMALHNIGKDPIEIFDGDRICQFMLLPYPKIELNKVEDNDDFYQGDRGGGIGSTDKKK